MKLTLATERASLGVIVLDGISAPAEYEPPPAPEAVGDVQPARRMYRSIGVDPTRHRPASEALFRRLRRGEPLPRIHVLVDWANCWSVRIMRPFGLYDLDRVEGDLEFRIGGPGEGYEGLGKPWVALDGHFVLADARGPIGNPSSDGFRTRITPETKRALVLVYGPPDDAHARLPEIAASLAAACTARSSATVLRSGHMLVREV